MMKFRFLKISGVVLLAGVCCIAVLWIWPLDTSGLRPRLEGRADYEESVRRIMEISTPDYDQEVADDCRSIFFTHGQRVQNAVVMYHGYTNCPRQYEVLARMFFERGYNVYVPRIPYHGLRDRTSREISRLTLEDLRGVCDRSFHIARGLGDDVTVLGLSLGGVMASWNAQFSEGVDTAVILVPSFGWYYLPGIVKPIANLAYFMPDQHLWWNPVEKTSRVIPHSMYYKFSSRGMGHVLVLGLSVQRAARQSAPMASRVIIMTTDLDRGVDDANIERLVKAWQRQGTRIQYHRLSAVLGVEHDIVDPLQPYQQTGVVYKKIFDMIEQSDDVLKGPL